MAHSLLKGKTALVTGAAQGLGRAIAMQFADEGATVALFDKSKRVMETCAELPGDGHKPFVLDVTQYGAVKIALGALQDEWGRFDILVNNAGIFYGGTVLTSTLDEWQKVITVNLEAMFMFSKFVAERMVERKQGKIVNIASVAGFASRGNVGAYNASKGGVMALTVSMAVELAPHNIAVNAVAPGMMRTAMLTTEEGQDLAETEDFKRTYLDGKRIPMGRVGEPEEIAGTVVFLASDYCRYMTGQTLVVDGGMTSTF
jgi:NAD(P)-dependent dehydrogenase (short-subunit alcohol dehydrogenase family)